jgi:serine/threonine protein kinase
MLGSESIQQQLMHKAVQFDKGQFKNVKKALVGAGGMPKITDFGMAMRMGQDVSHASNIKQGTPFYVAPELKNNFRLSRSSDVFAFAIIMWELMIGSNVFVSQYVLPMLTSESIIEEGSPLLVRVQSIELLSLITPADVQDRLAIRHSTQSVLYV